MRLVIDMDDRVYKNLMTDNGWRAIELAKAIKNGTPLPKGHGRLIDVDMIPTNWIDYEEDIVNAPTIIEADKDGD